MVSNEVHRKKKSCYSGTFLFCYRSRKMMTVQHSPLSKGIYDNLIFLMRVVVKVLFHSATILFSWGARLTAVFFASTYNQNCSTIDLTFYQRTVYDYKSNSHTLLYEPCLSTYFKNES